MKGSVTRLAINFVMRLDFVILKKFFPGIKKKENSMVYGFKRSTALLIQYLPNLVKL